MVAKIVSRKRAKAKGWSKYYTGKPCKYNHLSERLTGSGACVECEHSRNSSKENKERCKARYQKNIESAREYGKSYSKKWKMENKDRKNQYQREYHKEKYKTDPSYKATIICRSVLVRCLKATNSTKDTRTHELLGYCNEELKETIEDKFLQGMTWKSYGDWHIDHIYPVTRYIKDGVEDPSIINSLDNLIPMWAEHNLEKSDRTLEEYLDDRKDLVELYGRFL